MAKVQQVTHVAKIPIKPGLPLSEPPPKRARLKEVFTDPDHQPGLQYIKSAITFRDVSKPPLQPVPLNRADIPATATIIKMSNATTRSKAAKEGKENKSSKDEEDTATPPVEIPQQKDEPLAAQVMSRFTARWDKFTAGFEEDLKKLTQTVGDENGGLVKRVSALEADVQDLKATPPDQIPPTTSRYSFNSKISQINTTYSIASLIK